MIIAFIFVLSGIILLILTVTYIKTKDSMQVIDKQSLKEQKKTLSNLWGIEEINNQVISTNKNHSIIVEIESVEYNLLHDDEREYVDRELIGIAQMLKFPIQFLEIKKQVDLEDAIQNIKNNTINANVNLRIYANEIANHLEEIQKDQDLFERKNYMIISSYNKKQVAQRELKEFYQVLKYHLLNIKIGTKLLNDIEITELIYEQLHKGSKNKIEDIKDKGGFELYVTSKKVKTI